LLEIKKENTVKLKEIFNNLPLAKIGRTAKEKTVKIRHGTQSLIDLPIDIVRTKWRRKVL